MPQQITFFRKSFIDIGQAGIILSEEANLQENGLDNLRDRSNNVAWITNGATDSETLNIVFDWIDPRQIDSIMIVGHNLDTFSIQYDVASVWTNFATPISESGNTETTSYFQPTAVTTTKIRLTINGTKVVDAEKIIQQVIVTEKLGQLEGWPEIKSASLSQNIQQNTSVSGKQIITRNTGGFKFSIKVKLYRVENDLELLERLYLSNQSFLVWVASGNEAQFSLKRLGYRDQDIFLMRASDSWKPNFHKGVYTSGFVFTAKFQEVIS